MINLSLKRIWRYTGFDESRGRKSDNTPIIIGTWKIPCYSGELYNERVDNVRRANRYLKHQQRRIDEAIRNSEFNLAIRMYLVLMQRSKSFRVCFFHRVAKGWYYSMNLDQVKKVWIKLDRIIKNLDTNIRSRRVYIPKPDGRMRPLGVPTLEWRIFISMWTDLMYMLIGMEIPHWQHGFMPGKSVLSAWKQVLQNLDELGDKARVWEFDLDGMFNRISLRELIRELEGYAVPKQLTKYLEETLKMFPLIPWEKIKPEKEIRMLTRKVRGDFNEDERVVSKSGFPQGLPISPLLSVFVAGAAFRTMGINPVMYADDGLIISESEIPFKNLQNPYLEGYGIIVSYKLKKNGLPATGEVKEVISFLGLEYNFKTKEFKINDTWIPRSQVNDAMLRGVAWNGYNNQDPNWKWNISKNSLLWLKLRNKIFSWENWKNAVSYYITSLQGKNGKYRRHGLVFIDTMESSSLACEHLLVETPKRNSDPFIESKPSSPIRLEDKFGLTQRVKGSYSFRYQQGNFNFLYHDQPQNSKSLERDRTVRSFLYKKYFDPYRTLLTDESNRIKGAWSNWTDN